jgi:hypothetical protein
MTTTPSSSPRTGRRKKAAAPPQRNVTGADESGLRADTASVQDREASADEQPSGEAQAGEERHTAHVNLPLMSAEFRAPQMRMPTMPGQLVQAAGAATSLLPPRDRLLYYGGLGTAAVLGVIEWPVAIAIGAGIAIAQRSHQEAGGRTQDSTGPAKATGPAETT